MVRDYLRPDDLWPGDFILDRIGRGNKVLRVDRRGARTVVTFADCTSGRAETMTLKNTQLLCVGDRRNG